MAQLLDALDLEERMNSTPPRTGATPAPRALGLFPPDSIAAAPLVFDQPSPGAVHPSPGPTAGDAATADSPAPPAEATEEALEGLGDSDEQAGVDATNPDGTGVDPGLAACGDTLSPGLPRTVDAVKAAAETKLQPLIMSRTRPLGDTLFHAYNIKQEATGATGAKKA